MKVIDLDIYRATGISVDYTESLGQALHDVYIANKAVEETLALLDDRKTFDELKMKVRRQAKRKPFKSMLGEIYGPLWPPNGVA